MKKKEMHEWIVTMEVGGFLICFLFIVFFLPSSWVQNQSLTKSKELIVEIEKYRDSHSRLPSNKEAFMIMGELGWQKSEACPCYDNFDTNSYKVWFGTTLGTSMIYSSTTGEWIEAG